MKNYFSQNQNLVSEKKYQKEPKYDSIINLFLIILIIVTAYSSNSLSFSLKKILSLTVCILSIILMIKRYYENKDISQNRENSRANKSIKFSRENENYIKNQNNYIFFQKNNAKNCPFNFNNNDFQNNNIKNNNIMSNANPPSQKNNNYNNHIDFKQQIPTNINFNLSNFNYIKTNTQITKNNKNNNVTNKDKLYINNINSMITPGYSNKKNNIQNSGGLSLSNPFAASPSNSNKNDNILKQNQKNNPKNNNKIDDSPINILISDSFLHQKNVEKYPKNMEKAYNKYYYFKKNIKNFENLLNFNLEHSSFKESEIEIPSGLIDDKYFENYVAHLKNFISDKLLNNIIDKNEKNLINLNKILEIFKIKIISSLTDSTFENSYLNILNEKLKYINSDILPYNSCKNILTERLLRKNYDTSYDAWKKCDFTAKKKTKFFSEIIIK